MVKKKRSSAMDSFKKKRKSEDAAPDTASPVVKAALRKLSEISAEEEDEATRSGSIFEANGFHTPDDGSHRYKNIDLRTINGSKDDERVRALVFTEEKFYEAIPGWRWTPASFRTTVGGPAKYYAYLISTGSTIATLDRVLRTRYNQDSKKMWIKEIRPSIAVTLLEELGIRDRAKAEAEELENSKKSTRIAVKRAVGDRTTYDYPAGCDTDEKRRKYRKQQRSLKRKGAKVDAD